MPVPILLNLHHGVSDCLCRINRGCLLSNPLRDEAADVRVRVGRAVVVHVEQPVIAVLVVITAHVEAGVRRVEVPVIARERPAFAQTAPLIFFPVTVLLLFPLPVLPSAGAFPLGLPP